MRVGKTQMDALAAVYSRIFQSNVGDFPLLSCGRWWFLMVVEVEGVDDEE
jgi:hypothetical protein